MVYFDEYEAGCYASGMIEFLLAPIEEVNLTNSGRNGQ